MSIHDGPISPLRQRMIEDLTLSKLTPKTQSGYIRWVKRLGEFPGRSPAAATAEDLRRFQLQVVQTGVGCGSVSSAVAALQLGCRASFLNPTYNPTILADYPQSR